MRAASVRHCLERPDRREVRALVSPGDAAVRARKAGALLRDTAEKAERATGRPPKNVPGGNIRPTLPVLGVTAKESSRWQALAEIPEKKFEEILRSEKASSEAAIVRERRRGPSGGLPTYARGRPGESASRDEKHDARASGGPRQ